MTNTEMLILSAKLFGFDLIEEPKDINKWRVGVALYTKRHYSDLEGIEGVVGFDRDGPVTKRWNPLDRNEDAFALLARADLHVQCDFEDLCCVIVYGKWKGEPVEVFLGEMGREECIRYAITKAAALMQKEKVCTQ